LTGISAPPLHILFYHSQKLKVAMWGERGIMRKGNLSSRDKFIEKVSSQVSFPRKRESIGFSMKNQIQNGFPIEAFGNDSLV
jgi:hypothetical protein